MAQLSAFLFALALLGYFAASVLYIAALVLRNRRLGEWATRTLVVVFGIHGLGLGQRWVESGHLPLVDLFEALSFYSWLTIIVYLLIERSYGYKAVGAFVTPVAFLSIALASVVPKESRPLVPVLESAWLPIHVGISFLAYTIFTMAFAVAILYLLQERELKVKKPNALLYKLPPLETMERLGNNAVGIGFPFMTLSIATGAVWAEQAWGSYWSWDPKQTMALITWLVFAAYFHLHNVVGWRGRRTAWLIVIGFASVLFTFLGVKLFGQGLHNFI
ncbi:MAG: c-type cytochrome biogenesis protein CcsB [Chloroflexi bacterium]|nr:c-type cytochrome biogenesis protein CcsB [Chloroflexota bacterium]MDA8187028.1 c-type cytochrome biogenesis protein CcsB [Dehalococcoidales bacterium]